MSPPTALVEALPHFVGEDPADASKVVKEYKELLEGDRSMLVHVIGWVTFASPRIRADVSQIGSDVFLCACFRVRLLGVISLCAAAPCTSCACALPPRAVL